MVSAATPSVMRRGRWDADDGGHEGKRRPDGSASNLVLCMQHTRPLQDHPEFSIRESRGCTEYRVESWRVARDGSGRVLRFYGWSSLDPVVPLLIAIFWQTVRTLFV